MPAAGADQRRAVCGALDAASGLLTWQGQERKEGDAFAVLLAPIATRWPDDQLVLVMDNVSDHRAPAGRTWWAAQGDRLLPFWLPVSPPHLTLIERVWRFLKQKLACHRCWSDVASREAATTTLLDPIEAHFHADPLAAAPPAGICQPRNND